MGWPPGLAVIERPFLAVRLAAGSLARFHIVPRPDVNHASYFKMISPKQADLGFLLMVGGPPSCPLISPFIYERISLLAEVKKWETNIKIISEEESSLMLYIGKCFTLLPPFFYDNDARYQVNTC